MEKNMRKEVKDQFLIIGGKNLRRLREERGLTQEQLAELAETSPKYLSPIENGKRNIGPELMPKLCKVFGVEPKEFEKGIDGVEIELNGGSYKSRGYERS